MTHYRNKQNYRFRTWKFRDRYHIKGGVRQGWFLSVILNYLSLNIFYCQILYSNGVGSQVLTTLVTTLPLSYLINTFL